METCQMLMRCAPEDMGVDSRAISAFVEGLNSAEIEMHSFLLMRHGRVAAQAWWKPYTPQHPHSLFSLSKSFVSTAVGLAIEEKRFQLDDPVISFFPEHLPEKVSDNLAAMRVRDLLSMSTGHEAEPSIRQFNGWEKLFFETEVKHRPGTYFLYNSVATFMAGCIVMRTTGEKLVEYLMPRLFEPLGIERPVWDENGDGQPCGGWGLNLKTEDIARFGQLLLQEGEWQGKQLVPQHWVRLATAWHIDNSRDRKLDWAQGYGFQFWRCRNDFYRGDGLYGQFCLVMPKYNAVLAMTSGTDDMQGILDCVYEHILPGFHDALPANPVASMQLSDMLEQLQLPALKSEDAAEIAPQLLGKKWEIGDNGRAIGVTLAKKDGGIDVTANLDSTIRFTAGYDALVEGTTDIFGGTTAPILSQAAVSANGAVEILMLMPTKPTHTRICLRPCGDGAELSFFNGPRKKVNGEYNFVKASAN